MTVLGVQIFEAVDQHSSWYRNRLTKAAVTLEFAGHQATTKCSENGVRSSLKWNETLWLVSKQTPESDPRMLIALFDASEDTMVGVGGASLDLRRVLSGRSPHFGWIPILARRVDGTFESRGRLFIGVIVQPLPADLDTNVGGPSVVGSILRDSIDVDSDLGQDEFMVQYRSPSVSSELASYLGSSSMSASCSVPTGRDFGSFSSSRWSFSDDRWEGRCVSPAPPKECPVGELGGIRSAYSNDNEDDSLYHSRFSLSAEGGQTTPIPEVRPTTPDAAEYLHEVLLRREISTSSSSDGHLEVGPRQSCNLPGEMLRKAKWRAPQSFLLSGCRSRGQSLTFLAINDLGTHLPEEFCLLAVPQSLPPCA